jgi:hypothetical protein
MSMSSQLVMLIYEVDIGAIASVAGALAAVAALWGVFRWFRPTFRARVDERRQAIRLDVANRGRASGWITRVAVIGPDGIHQQTNFAGFTGGQFKAAEVPGRTSWWLIIESTPVAGAFPEHAQVLVESRGRRRSIVPEVAAGLSYHGSKSNWPLA